MSHHYDPVSGLPKQLTTVYGTTQSSYVADTAYNALSQVEQYEFYTGLYSETGERFHQSYTRELETGRLTGSRTDRESISPYTVSEVRYTYDQVGNVVKIADVAAAGGVDNQCFRYDNLSWLREAWTPANGDCAADPAVGGLGGSAKYWLSWEVDAAGRQTKQIDHGTASGDRTTTYGYPANGGAKPHALSSTSTVSNTGTTTESYTYDPAGNTLTRPTDTAGTQTLTWDPEGRLAISTDSTGTTSYLYDADGNRLVRSDPTGKTLYLPGQEVRFTNSTGARTCTRYYIFNGQTIASRTTAGLTWLASDHQGTAQVSVKESGQQSTVRRQTPFGTPRDTQSSWPNSKGFVGGTIDNTGLTHLGAREYDAKTGRFISVDTVFNADAPEQMNGYAYSANSPVTKSDPTGLEPNGNWMYIGSERGSWTSKGYRYYYRADYYLFCRYGGSQCLGGYGGQTGWINMAYAGVPGVWLLARVVVAVWRIALNFIGPVASPPKPRVVAPQVPACPTPPVPDPKPKDELDGRCGFWDFACLVGGSKSAKKWWNKNRDWVTGVPALVGMGVCIVATAGVCAVAGIAGLGIAWGGRIADVAASENGFTSDNVARMGIGMGIDGAAFFIPGVRLFKTTRGGANVYAPRSWRNPTEKVSLTWGQQFKPKGQWDPAAIQSGLVAGSAQAAWFPISGPGIVNPLGVPWTDPMKWR